MNHSGHEPVGLSIAHRWEDIRRAIGGTQETPLTPQRLAARGG